MLGLYYFRWVGTPEEFKEYIRRVMSICEGTEGVNFKGVFVPSSEWNGAVLLEGPSLDKGISVMKTYIQKYGPHPKIPVAKLELLFTYEELGHPQ